MWVSGHGQSANEDRIERPSNEPTTDCAGLPLREAASFVVGAMAASRLANTSFPSPSEIRNSSYRPASCATVATTPPSRNWMVLSVSSARSEYGEPCLASHRRPARCQRFASVRGRLNIAPQRAAASRAWCSLLDRERKSFGKLIGCRMVKSSLNGTGAEDDD